MKELGVNPYPYYKIFTMETTFLVIGRDMQGQTMTKKEEKARDQYISCIYARDLHLYMDKV